MLRRGVEDARILRREDDRIRPLPALGEHARRLAGEEARIDLNVANLAVGAIVACEQRTLAAGGDDVRVARVGRDVARLAAADVVHPVAELAGARPAEIGPIVRGKAERGTFPRRSSITSPSRLIFR